MKDVYFVNSKNEARIISQNCEDDKEVMQAICNFLYEHSYKSYYTRTWTDEQGKTWYDVGSHTEFFYTEETE